jgi:hypothetical protein
MKYKKKMSQKKEPQYSRATVGPFVSNATDVFSVYTYKHHGYIKPSIWTGKIGYT